MPPPLSWALEGGEFRSRQRCGASPPLRQGTAERATALAQVLNLGTVVGRAVEGGVGDFIVQDGNLEAIAERPECLLPHLLLLVGDVLAFARLAHAVALDGLGQNHGRLLAVPGRFRIGGVNLVGIVAAAVEAPDVFVAHVRDHSLELRVAPEESLASVGAPFRLEGLVLAVDCLLHALAQQARRVLVEQRVPVRAPNHLDDLPARTVKRAFEFLDDLAVAAYRPIQTLQVAVDDEDEVVEPLPRGEGDGAHRLRLVHLAVAHEGPDLSPFGVDQLAVVQVLHEAGLVDGHDRAESHRDGRELPEVRHQPWMGVRGETLAIDFTTEAMEPVFGNAPFQIGARVHSGSAVSLKKHQVAAVRLARRAPEVVETDVVEGGGRGETGDVSAKLRGESVCLHHHRERVPANEGADAPLDHRIAGSALLSRCGNRVQVRSIRRVGQVDPGAPGLVAQDLQDEMGALDSVPLQQRVQRLNPFFGFLRVNIGLVRLFNHGLGLAASVRRASLPGSGRSASGPRSRSIREGAGTGISPPALPSDNVSAVRSFLSSARPPAILREARRPR